MIEPIENKLPLGFFGLMFGAISTSLLLAFASWIFSLDIPASWSNILSAIAGLIFAKRLQQKGYSDLGVETSTKILLLQRGVGRLFSRDPQPCGR